MSSPDASSDGASPSEADSDAYRDGGVIFITFDEAGGSDGNRVATLMIFEQATPGLMYPRAPRPAVPRRELQR